MNSCNRSAEAVEYLLGLMEPALTASFLQHASECEACSHALETEKKIETALSKSYDLPEGLLDRVKAAIDMLERPPQKWLKLKLAIVACGSSGLLYGLWRVIGGNQAGFVAGDQLQQMTQFTARLFGSSAAGLMGLAFGLFLTLATVLALVIYSEK